MKSLSNTQNICRKLLLKKNWFLFNLLLFILSNTKEISGTEIFKFMKIIKIRN